MIRRLFFRQPYLSIIIILGVVIAVMSLITVSTLFAQASQSNTSAVLTVDGEAITAAELAIHMDRNRAEIAQHYQQQFGAEADKGFWSRRYGEETPAERLQAVASEQAVRMKVEQMLAREAGVVADIGYKAFVEAMEAENTRRANAIMNNQVVYGPARFDMQSFHMYYMSMMRNAVVQELTEKRYLALVEQRLQTAHIKKVTITAGNGEWKW